MRSVFLCLAAGLFGAGLAQVPGPLRSEAGTAVRLDLEQLVEHSDLVLEAQVVAASPVEIGGEVSTDYQLLVDRTWWGEDQATRTIRLPGGMLPSGRGTLVPGMPQLAPGDDLILMLSAEGSHQQRVVVGLSQGRWRIVGDGRGGKVALRSGEGTALIDGQHSLPLPADQLEEVDYADLVSRIEAAVGARRAREGK